jgi:hypothetical protein
MPDNVAETVEKFRQVDPARLRRLMGHTAEDHFFKDAGLGVARFCPAVAVAKHRELALDVVGRTGLPLRQGILSLVAHSALLDEKVVDEMIALAVACSNEEIRDLNDRSDLFLVQDRALLAALPHKSGDAQLEILMRLGDTELSYDVVGLFRAADAGLAHERLARALDDRDVVGLRNVLCFLHFSDTRILPGALPLLVGLFSSPDEMVRAHALGITLRTENEGLLRALLASGWSAKTLDPRRNVLEIWLGSRLMGLACQRGLIEACAALERMAFPHYGLIAISGQASAAAVAAKVDMALRRVLAIRDWPQLAEIRQQISDDRDSMPPPMSVALKESSGASKVPVADAETEDDDWERQQACAWQSYDRLSEALTDADARLVLDHLSQDCVDRLVAVDPAVAMNWMSAWLTASKPQKKALGFFGLQLVSALANVGVVDVTFLENVCSVHPMIGVVSGYASVPAIARTLWRNVQSPGLREYCIARLHKAQNNADIAEEVLAALSAGQQQVLDNYIDELLAEEVPARTCRALTVAGFLHKSQNAETIFDRFSEAKGFVGDAVAAAKYAYERDLWAHHWYLKMLAATTNEEFWLHSRLFLKVVDARFSLWSKSKIEGGVIHRTYFPTVIEALEQRFERWRTQRQKELFGGKPP